MGFHKQPAFPFDHADGKELRGHQGWITSLAFNHDGTRLASADQYGQVLLWELNTGNATAHVLSGHTGAVHSIAFNHDGSLLASGGADHTVRMQALARPQDAYVLTEHNDAVLAVAFSPDGSLLASGGADRKVRMGEIFPHKVAHEDIGEHKDIVCRVLFNGAGTLLASASADRTVQLWKIPGKAWHSTLAGHSGRVSGIAFAPNDPRLFSADWVNNSLRVWDSSSGAEGKPIDGIPCACGRGDWVPELASSADGRLASAGYCDGSIRLWNVTNGTMIAQLIEHNGPVSALAFSRDGQLLASADGGKHVVRVWRESLTVQLATSRAL